MRGEKLKAGDLLRVAVSAPPLQKGLEHDQDGVLWFSGRVLAKNEDLPGLSGEQAMRSRSVQ